MTSRLNPYISYDGNAREAMEFYRSVFGGTLSVSTFGEMGDTDNADKVMHAMLETDRGFALMGADTPAGMDFDAGARITISLSGDDRDDLRRWFTALAEGGTVTMPLAVQAWGDEFGMCIDRFGVGWMANIAVAG